MASRCCGKRLSLRNQYDTQTPRASLSKQDCYAVHICLRAVRRPVPHRGGTSSRHETMHSAGFENVRRKFRYQESAPEDVKRFLRNSPRTPPTPLSELRAEVFVTLTPAQDTLQAVLRYRFHPRTRVAMAIRVAAPPWDQRVRRVGRVPLCRWRQQSKLRPIRLRVSRDRLARPRTASFATAASGQTPRPDQ